MSEWPDGTIIRDFRIDNHNMVFDCNAIADVRVCDPRALMNLTAFSDDRSALNVNVWMNDCVASDLCVTAHVRVGWIDECNSAVEHQSANGVASQKILELGKFRASVDAGNFSRIVMMIDGDVVTIVP